MTNTSRRTPFSRAAANTAAQEARKAKAWPIEHQRRSNTDWDELLPPEVAKSQISYERHQTALAMSKVGYSFQAIGDAFGVTSVRARQLVAKASRPQWQRSPVERWMSFSGDIAVLVPFVNKPKPRDIWHLASKHALAA